MPKMSSIDATIHVAQYFIYALHNIVPEIPLVKLVYSHKEALRSLSVIFRKSTPPRKPFKGASQEGIPIKTPAGEPRKNPNEECIPIKSIHQCITYEGAHHRFILRITSTNASIKNPD